MRISVLILALFILPLHLKAENLLDIRISRQPVSACDGSLGKLYREVRAAQPYGYVSPKKYREALAAANKPFANYLKTYPVEVATALGTSARPIVRVATVKELPSVRIALISERLVMSAINFRVSEGIESNEYPDDYDMFTSAGFVTAGGHDLQRHELLGFQDLVKPEAREIKGDSKLSARHKLWIQAEKEFWSRWMTPELIRDETFQVYISSDTGEKAFEVIGHEMLHAQFFTSEKFRDAVLEFWRKKVSEEDRFQHIRNLLPAYDNIFRDEVLAANEFMAYVLQPNAVGLLLEMPDLNIPMIQGLRREITLVQKYRGPLLRFLQAKGVSPIQVKM